MSDFLESLFQRRRVRELSAQLKQRGILVDQLESQLLELRRGMTNLANTQRETAALVQDLELLLEETREKELTLEDDLRAERSALSRKEAEFSAERRAREASEAQLRGEIGQLLDVLRETNATLGQKGEELRAERSVREAAEAELRALIDSMAARGESAEQTTRATLAELEQLKGTLQSTQTELLGERRSRKDREAELHAIREDLAARKANGAELEVKLAVLASEIGERDKELSRVREEIAHSAARLAELEGSLRLEESASQSSKTAHTRTEALLQHEREARAKLEQNLRNKIEGLIERRDQIKGVVQDTSTELERVRATLRLAERELAAERDLRRHEVEAARSAAKAGEQARMETKALLRDAHDALRAEREGARTMRSAFDRESSERARLAHELAHDPAQLRIAALEEQAHTRLARALDFAEPVVVARETGVARRAAPDPARTAVADQTPKRLIVIASEDPLLLSAAVGVISALAGAAALPLAPADASDLDAWLRQAMANANDPKVAVLPVNAAILAAAAAQTHDSRALNFAAMLMRARVLHLVWSDKCLSVAHRQLFGAGGGGDTFDDGDARMSVPLYRDLIRREQRLLTCIHQSGLLKAVDAIKMYAELADAPAIIQFCRDAGLAIKPARLANVGALVESDEPTLTFARRIRAAVEAQAARHELDGAPLTALARAQERAGRYADASSTYENALRQTPDDLGVRLALASYLELAGHIGDADATLRDARGGSHVQAIAAGALRKLYRRAGDDEKAYAAAELMHQAGAPQGALAVAASAAALERTEQARQALAALEESAPSPAQLRVEAIVRLQESLPGLRDAAEQGGAQDWFRLGEALRQLDKVEAAAHAYQRAEGASPGLLKRMCGEGVGPDLLLIGPPRTATTLLRKMLELHRSVALLDGESSFLANVAPTALESFVERVAAVRARKPGALIGDKSPLHFALSSEHVALAALLFPHARIIVTTREPVARAFSEIKRFGHRRVTEASIAAALGEGTVPRWLENVFENSRYRKHVKTWATHFGADRLLLLQCEDFEQDIASNCQRVFARLGLQPLDEDALTRLQRHWSNRTAEYRLDPHLEAMLRTAVGQEPYAVRDLEAAIKPGSSRRRSRTP